MNTIACHIRKWVAQFKDKAEYYIFFFFFFWKTSNCLFKPSVWNRIVQVCRVCVSVCVCSYLRLNSRMCEVKRERREEQWTNKWTSFSVPFFFLSFTMGCMRQKQTIQMSMTTYFWTVGFVDMSLNLVRHYHNGYCSQ